MKTKGAVSRLHNQVVQGNEFYRDHYDKIIMGLVVTMLLSVCVVCVVLYQIHTRALPTFQATQATGQSMPLVPNDEPNLSSDTLIRWASKAVVAAYTFSFVDYPAKLQIARAYFTSAGWSAYRSSINSVLLSITANQLFVNSVVAGPPVISNQGDLIGKGYTWRIQLPFLVTYQSAEKVERKSFLVSITIVKVPTWQNPDGIGIDQFVMV